MAAPKGHKRYGGRLSGTPNKATTDVREAIANVLKQSAPEFQKWINQVADGIPKRVIQKIDEKGEPYTEVEWLRQPDPYKAMDLIAALSEYHIPKLARTEMTGDGGGPLKVEVVRFT